MARWQGKDLHIRTDLERGIEMRDDVNRFDDAASDQDHERFVLWYQLHLDRLLAQCTRLLRDRAAAEDVAHETLLRAWLSRERMRDEDLGAWLSVVARNLCISHLRKHRRTVPVESIPETAEYGADPAAILILKETGTTVRRALSEVGERHRRLLYLRDVHEVEYEELGSDLGLTAAAARAVLFRARRMLRRRLAAVGEGLGAWVAGVRIRVSGVANRARGAETTVAPALQAGMNLALAAGIALSGFSVVGGTLSTGGAPTKAIAVAPRADAIGGAHVEVIDGSGGAVIGHPQGRSETNGPGDVLEKVPKSPVPPPAAHDPGTGDNRIGATLPIVGPAYIYGNHVEDDRPCQTCSTKNAVFLTLCEYDPRFCEVDSDGGN